MSASSLSKEVRDSLGIGLANGMSMPLGRPPLPGYFWLELAMQPPTTTHHDLEIKFRTNKAGRNHPTLRKSDRLRAVWDLYLAAIPLRPAVDLIPLAPPVVLHVSFVFHSPTGLDDWHTDKPDLDNSVKALKDVLALRRFIDKDQHVAKEVVEKLWTAGPGRIFIYARTLGSLEDRGRMNWSDECKVIGFPPAGHIWPLYGQVKEDVEHAQRCRTAQSVAARGGTPGGARRPEAKRGRANDPLRGFPSIAPHPGSPKSPPPQKGGKRK